ncbi:MAG: 23S rRNA (adenine(2503)-C(2))-methyltransferase RlmN [Acidobacteria bacterium]|nr:23S rRNA (adenine(2503)-C(2))-methyltransferase RlmN [Acidobacteriota bacterium]
MALSRNELHRTLGPWVDRPFRAKQVFEALHKRRVPDFEAMTELSLSLRQRLSESFRIGLPEVRESRRSADGTVKVLFALHDGASIEAVDIPDGRRRTFCISSQAGCPLACRFCVTGYWGAGRDLSAGEIVGQVYSLLGQEDTRKVTTEDELPGINIVFMGMGEPLLNADAVRKSIELLAETVAPRRMTLSTVGILPALEEMISWPVRPNLAVSLHAPDDERRSRIMPVNRNYPLRDLMALLRRFPVAKGRRITFEYILIRDFNDQPETARALAALLRDLPSKVNLIPINPDPVLGGRMQPPDLATVLAFQEELKARGVFATIRRQRGDEVSGACGQLRAFARDPRGFRTPVNL